jgi:predicted permease
VGLFGFAYRSAHVGQGFEGSEASVQLVSDNYFRSLGVLPEVGRSLDDMTDRGSALAVISDRLWQRQFAKSRAALGETILLNAVQYTIVGVMPPSFTGVSLDESADIWIPLEAQPRVDGTSLLSSSGTNWVRIMVRLPPATARQQAVAEVSLRLSEYAGTTTNTAPPDPIELLPAARPDSASRQGALSPLTLLFGLVSLLLVVTCVNVAHLVSARGAARTREFAIRLAIGASRERLIRQLLTESLCLSLIGALLGIGLAALANAALVRYLSAQPSLSFHVPDWLSFHVDVNVLIFALVAATLAGLVTALAPARAAARGDLTAGLKASHRGLLRANGRRGRSWPLVTQFAVCLLLLAIAGLFVRSFQKIGEVDLGFRTNHLMQVDIDWGRSSSSDTEINQWLEEFAEDVRAIPGVEAVSMSAPGVFSRSTWQATLRVPGDRQAVTPVQVTSAAPGYFSTLGIPLRGRDFGSQDRAKSARVVILSETAARTHFPTGEAIGKQVRLFDAPDPVEVIGVAGDIRLRSVLAAPRRWRTSHWRKLGLPYRALSRLSLRVRCQCPVWRPRSSDDYGFVTRSLTRL